MGQKNGAAMVNAFRTFILELIAIAVLCLGIVIGDSTTPGPITMIFLGLGLLSLAGISR
jgi:hypothetical protein